MNGVAGRARDSHRRRARRGKVPLAPIFPVLDTLRAVGALAVLTTHVAFQSGDYVRHGIIGAALSRLDIGVAIFFVLSGFLLARPYLARAATGMQPPRVRRYYRKRVLRIYPVYVIAVVVALTVVPNDHRVGVGEWIRTLTLTNVFADGPLPQGLTQMWSLSVEVTFYLVLPWLMLLMLGRPLSLRPGRVLLVLAAGVALACAWHLSLAGTVDAVTSGAPLLWLPAHLTWFLVGIALALAHVLHAADPAGGPAWVRLLARVGAMPGVCWATVAGLLLVAATPVGGPILLFAATPDQSLTKHLLYALIAGLAVLTGIFDDPVGRFARVASTPALRHLGHISYSVFCIHLTVLNEVRLLVGQHLFRGQGVLLWVLTVLLTLVASELLYRAVELPALRLKDRRSRPAGRPGSTRSPTQASTTR